MSTNDEKIIAQGLAFKCAGREWSRHLIGPAELEFLLNLSDRCREESAHIRKLCSKAEVARLEAVEKERTV